MPRYNKRRKNYRKPQTYRRVRGEDIGASIGAAGYRLAKKALKALNVEYKSKEVYVSNAAMAGAATYANGQLFELNGLAAGSGSDQRDGNQVEFKAISCHAYLKLNAPTGDTYNVRMIIFKVKNGNGSIPTVPLALPAGDVTTSFYDLDFVPQGVQILKDTTFHMDSNTSSKNLTFTIEKDIKPRYLGAGGTYTDIAQEGVWCAIMSTSGGSGVKCESRWRLRYVDN